MNINKILFCVAMILCVFSVQLRAEVSVIVNKSVTVSATESDIRRIFLGKTKTLPGGHKVVPVNLNKGSPAREEFGQKLLKKSESQLKSYWSKLIFTGKGQPPKDSGNESDIVNLVASNPNIIGYVSAGSVTDQVNVLATY